MEEYVKASKELLDEKREKPLAFAMEARRVPHARVKLFGGETPRQDRVREVWLGNFPREGLATEESMRKFAAAGRTAQTHGRSYIGSAEGESLQAPQLGGARHGRPPFRCSLRAQDHCKPQWARLPKLDSVPAGPGSWRDRASAVTAASRAGAALDRMDFLGYAHFQVARDAAARARPHARPVARGPRNGVGASLHPVQSV